MNTLQSQNPAELSRAHRAQFLWTFAVAVIIGLIALQQAMGSRFESAQGTQASLAADAIRLPAAVIERAPAQPPRL